MYSSGSDFHNESSLGVSYILGIATWCIILSKCYLSIPLVVSNFNE